MVSSLGLLYTTFAHGEDSIMVPNNVVLSVAIVPLREPAAVDLRARLRPDVRPSDVQEVLEETVQTPMRGEPRIVLEEIDGDEVVVRMTATRRGPRRPAAGRRDPRRGSPRSPARSTTSGRPACRRERERRVATGNGAG